MPTFPHLLLEIASLLVVDQHQVEVVAHRELLVDIPHGGGELVARQEEPDGDGLTCGPVSQNCLEPSCCFLSGTYQGAACSRSPEPGTLFSPLASVTSIDHDQYTAQQQAWARSPKHHPPLLSLLQINVESPMYPH